MKYDYYITGTIGEAFDWWTGQRGTTANMVRHFLNENKDKEVTIAVSSPGGYLNEGITMAEMIAAHGNVNIVIIGMTASAATVLAMKAKSVKVASGSLILIHNSSQYILSLGQANKQKLDSYIEGLRKTRENLDTIDKAMADIYSHRNHKSIEENMAMMDKERWMTAQEAVEFGIVDSILDDDETKTQAQAIQNVYASYQGIEEHFCLPEMPKVEKAAAKVPKGIMAKLKGFLKDVSGIMDNEDDKTVNNNINQTSETMNKKFVKVNALLKVEGVTANESGVVLTEAQMQVIEDALAELQGKVENKGNIEQELAQAKTDKKTAEDALAEEKTKLANLQQEFDDFKAQAGDDTVKTPQAQAGGDNNPTSVEMFNEIKNIL